MIICWRRCITLTSILCLAFTLSNSAFAQPKVSISTGQQDTAAANVPADSSYALPNNFYGAHLLVEDGLPGTKGYTHLQWARHLVGRWGYAKTLVMGIDENTLGPAQRWIDYVERCYALELIPLIRLGGHIKDGQWVAPQPDRPGNYRSMAEAIKRVVEGLPRSELCPLYIELWNEPNLAVEWTGKPDPTEYADFFVQAAAAIRSIGDERIKILNGGLATSADWTEKLCKANPDFILSFDIWSSHPYPHNHPPSINFHDKTVPAGTDMTIDAYLPELDVLERLGRPDVKVMITETGYDLGNSARAGYPIIDEHNRADYIMRAFRDYWPKWPEIVAVFPFQFCNEGWQRFDWVYPDSGTNADGSPTRPHPQYTAVAALAKPTDTTGAVSGTVRIDKLGSRLEGVTAVAHLKGVGGLSDPMGNYFVPKLEPGPYRIVFSKPGFARLEKKVTVSQGTNTVLDVSLVAKDRGVLIGTVRSSGDGKPIRGVEVSLEPGDAKTRTDSRGRYELKDCIPGRYTLQARERGLVPYKSAPIDVKPVGANRHDFVLGRQTAPEGESLIHNGGFEAGGGGGAKTGVGLGFEPAVPGLADFQDAYAQLTNRLAHTGQWAQEIRMRSGETVIRQITHYGTAQPRADYLAGAWVRVTSMDTNAEAWITLDFTRNDGGIIERAASKPAGGRSTEWVWLEARRTAPADSQRVSVGLHTRGTRGSALFDDVYLGIIEN